jgi:hypothetical protein
MPRRIPILREVVYHVINIRAIRNKVDLSIVCSRSFEFEVCVRMADFDFSTWKGSIGFSIFRTNPVTTCLWSKIAGGIL